jgi:hypothetical protein
MPGIANGEAASVANPLLPFFYQNEGVLTDIYSLRFEIYAVGTVAVKHAANLDMTADKVAMGVYAAPFDSSTVTLTPGAHEIVWYYKVESSSSETSLSYRFEVLDPAYFRTGKQFMSYIPSDVAILDPFDMKDRHRITNSVSRDIERMTGRFFFPRYMDIKHSVRPKSSIIWLDQPVIGVNSVVFESAGVISGTLTTTDVELADLRIFNRHLNFLLTPDDRQNPKIGFARVGGTAADVIEPSIFPSGLKNIKVTGVFGYTDPDGGPFGETPQPLQEVIETLAYRRIADPSGTNLWLRDPSRVKKARTRDQEIQFDTSGGSGSSGSGTLTGDSHLDDILMAYMRPPHIGVAG